ncbi:unnamed protein product [Paramecium sonneborni]|uniref:WD domain, G-beta repeat protein n=1 Tax=Paramecium sonneborni TaxID=65129 RepID=A0A8S1RD28_9CILI|nr:unnamed protein product [Paramecium sonneborni]
MLCQPLQCSNIQTQFSCATNPNCVWFRGECQNFKFCADLIGASQSECIFQSVNCPASNGLFCREKNYLQPCQTYQFQSSCTDALGNNGFCLWQNGSCQVLSKCQQLLQQKDCLNFQKQCYWSNNICQPLSCSIFTNPQNCQYYYSSINSYTPISCYWNSYQSLCAQTTDFMTQLNSATCSANTRQTARWSNTLSICLKCGAPPLPNPYKCACSFLISQINCMQSQECIWNTQTNQCEQQSCINLKQSLCIQNSQCMWVGFCAAFKSQECAAQSLRCPYFNSEKGQCEAISSYINCGYVDNQNQCDQYYSINFRCEWNYQQNKCQIYISCQQYYNPYICNTQPQCYWYNYGCQIKTCQNYNTLESCTFVFNPNIWNYIQSCSWLNGACVAANNLFSEQTCFINTDQTARWSSNNQDGYCIPCSISLSQLVVPKNKCLCSQILTEYECNQANCYWDQGYCSEEFCPESQVQCAQNPKCYWIYQRENYTYGYCRQIPVIKIQEFCTTLRGNNSLECLSQTIQCPVSLDGVCQSKEHLQTCQSMKSLQLCSNGIGQEGYCKYENQSCQVLSSCKQLKSFTECNIFNKACYWDMSTGLCEQMTCESQSQATCTYVFQSINQANIQQCYWNGRSCSSELYVISSYSFQTCFQNTGGTYHWSNSKSNYGSCVSCSLNRIKPKHTCSCTVLNEKECTLAKPVCKFNQNKQCVKSACQEIFNSVTCSEQIECMWQSNQCVDFTSCTDLYGSSSLDCIAQSLQCQVVSNHICKSVQSLNTCSQYSMEFCKIDIIGSDGLCYWNSTNKVCQVISSCDKVTNQSICQYLNRTCQWSYFFQSCVPFQCQDYPYEELCTNVIVNLQDPQIMLCVWKNQKCIPYEDTYYRFDDSICYANSDHTYRWVKEDKYGVRCQQCLSTFLTNNNFQYQYFLSQQMSSINILCPFHQKVVSFMNIDFKVKLGDRIACDDCGLIRPISIVSGLEFYNLMITNQNSEIDRLLDQEVKTLQRLKTILYKKTEELLQNIKQLEKEIDQEISLLIQEFSKLKLEQHQIGSTTLTQLQQIALQISLFKNQEKDLFDQIVVEKLKQYQATFFNQYDTALQHIQIYKNSIQQLITYKQCFEHPQKICFDLQIVSKHNLIITHCENLLRSYQFQDGKLNLFQEENTHRSYIETICLSNSQKFLFTGGVDKIIRIWQISDQGILKLDQELKCHKDCIKSIVINSQDKQLFSTGYDKNIIIWNKYNDSWCQTQILNEHTKEVIQLSLNQSDNLLISVSWDRSINIYKSISGLWQIMQKIENPHNNKIYSVCFINDGLFITGSRELIIWEKNSSSEQFIQQRTIISELECIDRIKYLPSLKLMTSQSSNALDIWRFKEHNEPYQIQSLKGLYQGSTLTNDGQYLIGYNVENKKFVICQRNF